MITQDPTIVFRLLLISESRSVRRWGIVRQGSIDPVIEFSEPELHQLLLDYNAQTDDRRDHYLRRAYLS